MEVRVHNSREKFLCLTCHLPLKKHYKTTLTEELSAYFLIVCERYLSPRLLNADNFKYSQHKFFSSFCPVCAHEINEIIKIYENLTKIQQTIQELVDSFSKNALQRRKTTGGKKGQVLCNSKNLRRPNFRSDMNVSENNKESELNDSDKLLGSSSESRISIESLQLKELRICLERIDSTKGSDGTPSIETLSKSQDNSLQTTVGNFDSSRQMNPPYIGEARLLCGIDEFKPKNASTICGIRRVVQENYEHDICGSDAIEEIDNVEECSIANTTKSDSAMKSASISDTDDAAKTETCQYVSLQHMGELGENNFRIEPTQEKLHDTKEIPINLNRVLVHNFPDLQDSEAENSTEKDHCYESEYESYFIDDDIKIDIEEFIDHDHFSLPHEAYDSDMMDPEKGNSPMLENSQDECTPDRGPRPGNLNNNTFHKQESNSNNLEEIKGRPIVRGRMKRKAAIVANSRIVKVPKKLLHLEQSSALSSVLNSYEESSEMEREQNYGENDDDPTCNKNLRLKFPKRKGRRIGKGNITVCNSSLEKMEKCHLLKGKNCQKDLNNLKIYKWGCCEELFTCQYDLEIHSLSHEQQVPFECPICHEKYLNSDDYEQHFRESSCQVNSQEENNDEFKFICHMCGKTFKGKYLLLHHRLSHTRNRKCVVCDSTAHDYDHFLSHTKETALICDICGMPLKRFSYFKEHRLSHVKVNSFTISLATMDDTSGIPISTVTNCQDQSLTDKMQLITKKPLPSPAKMYFLAADHQRHLEEHVGEIPFECPNCHLSFDESVADYKKHMRSSECLAKILGQKAKKFRCLDCKATYNAEYLLMNHQKMHNKGGCAMCGEKRTGTGFQHFLQHTGEISCVCDICRMPIYELKNLESHRLTHMSEECQLINCSTILNKCKICRKILFSENDIYCEMHWEDEFYECPVCYKKFRTMTKYCNHAKVSKCQMNIRACDDNSQKYDCKDCQETFKAKYLLLEHTAMKHNNSKCTICHSKRENTNPLYESDHFLTHTKETVCVCDICGMSMLQFQHFRQHRKIHNYGHISANKVNAKPPDVEIVKSENNDDFSSAEIPFKCWTCHETFSFAYMFLEHLKDSSCPVDVAKPQTVPAEEFECELCRLTFKAKYILLKHRAYAHFSGKCEICDEVLTVNIGYLAYDHFLMHTNEILCYCDICGKPLKRISYFRSHRLSHTGKMYQCDYKGCSKEFSQKSVLTTHRNKHRQLDSGKTFTCAICHKGFPLQMYLKKHEKSHLKHLHLCNFCGKTFSTQKNLNKHSQQHTGYLYPCSSCDKKFPSKSLLNKHYQIEHLKGYPCTFCDKYLENSSKREKHIQLRHAAEKPFPCEICGLGYPDTKSLKRHQKNCHSNEKFQCLLCEKVFPNKQALYIHSRHVHSEKVYKCDICQKTFATDFNLTTHKRSHSGEKPYQCEECGKTFTRKDNFNTHVKMHRKDKQGPHNCETCAEPFANKKNLSEHMKTIHNVKISKMSSKLSNSELESSSELDYDYSDDST